VAYIDNIVNPLINRLSELKNGMIWYIGNNTQKYHDLFDKINVVVDNYIMSNSDDIFDNATEHNEKNAESEQKKQQNYEIIKMELAKLESCNDYDDDDYLIPYELQQYRFVAQQKIDVAFSEYETIKKNSYTF